MFNVNLILLIFIFVFASPVNGQGLLSTGLEISVTGDMVSNLGFNDDYTGDDKVTMRGAELMLYAPIDYQFDGFLFLATFEIFVSNFFKINVSDTINSPVFKNYLSLVNEFIRKHEIKKNIQRVHELATTS